MRFFGGCRSGRRPGDGLFEVLYNHKLVSSNILAVMLSFYTYMAQAYRVVLRIMAWVTRSELNEKGCSVLNGMAIKAGPSRVPGAGNQTFHIQLRQPF